MPSSYPGRGSRVVADTEKYRLGRDASRALSTVLLPTPEGPETTKVLPLLIYTHSYSSFSLSSLGANRSGGRADSTTWSLSMMKMDAVLRP